MHSLTELGLSEGSQRAFLRSKYGSSGSWGSTAERYLAYLLNECGWTAQDILPQFQLGPYRVDFLVPKARAVVEVDGIFHELEVTKRRDRELDALTASIGLLGIRIQEKEVILDGPGTARRLAKLLRTRSRLVAP